jgi:hypothetical protein
MIFYFKKLNTYGYRSRGKLIVEHMKNSKIVTEFSDFQKNQIVKISLPDFSHSLLTYLKDNNIPFILDVTDYKFNKIGLKNLYIDGAKNAIAITTTCSYLADVCKNIFNKEVYIIKDPTERKESMPNVRSITHNDSLKIVWYGIRDNMKGINFDYIGNKIRDIHSNVEIQIITNKKESDPKDWIQWSYEIQQEIVNKSDIVLIPTVNTNHLKAKGNNRPVDALRQGKFVVCGPDIPSYYELGKFIHIGDYQEGIRFFLSNKNKVEKKIINGQKFVQLNYTPNVIASQWQELENKLRLKM